MIELDTSLVPALHYRIVFVDNPRVGVVDVYNFIKAGNKTLNIVDDDANVPHRVG
ncbi:hypothetical protein D3C86_2263460 [compost metagenome]